MAHLAPSCTLLPNRRQSSPRFRSELLVELVREAATLAVGATKTAGPAIEVEIAAQMTVDVDRTRIIQAITNVLQNAIDAYEGRSLEGPIRVRATASEGSVVLSIEDSGCGMSKESVADVGSLFATTKPNGTGFGLALAMKIVDSEHGGRLGLRVRRT